VRLHVLHWLEQFLHPDIASLLAPSWFTCVGLAGLVTLALMLGLARRRGIDAGTVASAVLWCYIAAVLAGIAVPMLIDGVEHLVATGRFHLRWSGMTSFWGYLAGTAAVALVCRRDRVSLARFGDLSVIPLGVALALARLGCFMAGCDYGKVSSLPWAVRFPAGSPAWRDHVHAGLIPLERATSLPVHPTQLYEAALGLVIAGLAIAAARRPRRDGSSFLAGAATYAIGRLLIETLRGDAGRGIHAGLSSGQIFSLLVLLVIAARLIAVQRRAWTGLAAGALVLASAHLGVAAPQPPPRSPQPALHFAPRDLGPSQPQPPAPRPAPTDPGPPQQPDARPVVPEPPLADGAIAPESAPAPEPPAADGFTADSGPVPEPSAADGAVTSDVASAPDPTERPLFSTGVLLGIASPINRRAGQVPTLMGASASIGWLPGRFGVWLDVDSYANSEASHGTLLAAFSFTYRPSRRLALGVRSGIGLTLVNFKDPAFRDVTGKTVRLDAMVEYALVRHWAVWLRPISIDMLDAPELGGPITTYQFRAGVAYRFGSRRNTRAAPASPPPPPTAAPPPPPAIPPLPPLSSDPPLPSDPPASPETTTSTP
jgi:phosphatidylglycerol:prolipoprotein diacylglycerol transferase